MAHRPDQPHHLSDSTVLVGAEIVGGTIRRPLASTNPLRVVTAIDDEAARFYQHYGVRKTPVEGRLLRKVSDIVADLAVG
ncbi:MAG TPA: hypothetical protein VFZ63_17445 [Jiangellaceae bacterium]